MSRTHTEAVLNKLTKPELVQLLLNTEDNLRAEIPTLTAEVKELSSYFKKLEADPGIAENVNSRLVELLVRIERHCWKRAHYSRHECPELIGIPRSVKDDVVKEKVCRIFMNLALE